MQLLLTFTALLGLSPFVSSLPSSVRRQCNTRYGSVKPSTIRTVQFGATTTEVARQIVTTTPRITVTPDTVTSTVTTLSTTTSVTTAPTSTDTYTTSMTITSTSTSTDIESFTQTVTTPSTTTIASTTTVAPPIGFTALANEPGYVAKRNAVVERREALQERNIVKPHIPILDEAEPTSPALLERQAGAGNQYPVAVSCTASTTYFSTHTIVHTASTTVTSTAKAPTGFTTATVPVLTVQTVTPADATTTTTITVNTQTVVTSTTSTTTTSTTTTTIQVPVATYYAQCAPNNQVSTVVAQKIGTVSFNPAFTLLSSYPQDTTGYGCCVTCALAGNCAGYAQAPIAAGGACYYIMTDGRCDNTQSFGDKMHYYNTQGQGYTVGNGQCGFLSPVAGK